MKNSTKVKRIHPAGDSEIIKVLYRICFSLGNMKEMHYVMETSWYL